MLVAGETVARPCCPHLKHASTAPGSFDLAAFVQYRLASRMHARAAEGGVRCQK